MTDQKLKNGMFSSIKELKLPLEFNSNQEIHLKSYSIADDSILSKITQSETGFQLYGKTSINSGLVLLVGMIPSDNGSPLLITVDSNGKKIDSFLGYRTAGADMGWYCSNSIILNPSGKIEFIDSTLTREIKDDGSNEIPGTEKLTIRKKFYLINNEGFFKEAEGSLHLTAGKLSLPGLL